MCGNRKHGYVQLVREDNSSKEGESDVSGLGDDGSPKVESEVQSLTASTKADETS